MKPKVKNDNIKSGNKTKVSATGANKFKKAFSTPKKQKEHWGDHNNEYIPYGIKTQKQYTRRAMELVQSACDENILGFITKQGEIVRYDKRTNDFAKGFPDKYLKTMFKPKDGMKYFESEKRKTAVE